MPRASIVYLERADKENIWCVNGLRTIQEIKRGNPGERVRLAFALRGREGLSDKICTKTQGREGRSPFCKSERRCGEAGSSQP